MTRAGPYRVNAKATLSYGPLRLDPLKNVANLNGLEAHLTSLQSRLLQCFILEPDHPFTHEELGQILFVRNVKSRAAIDQNIAALRRKLGLPDRIETSGGDGYCLWSLTRSEASRPEVVQPRAIPDTSENGATPGVPTGGVPSAHGIRIDLRSHRAFCGERELKLSRSEFQLLKCFLTHAGVVLRREQLMDVLNPSVVKRSPRLIDAFVKALRHKLGDFDLIQTVHGVGYLLTANESGRPESATPCP
jgi:DNA-binding response OmpR family regulator